MAPTSILVSLLLAAQPGPTGSWTLNTAPDLKAVIESATASMNFVVRPIARGRLKKTNDAYKRIQIQRTATETVIQYDDRKAQHMPADGSAVAWTREDGEVFQISAKAAGADLVQTYKGVDGGRSNVFHVDPATGLLSVAVTITSPKLPQPMTYTLTYKN